jgi:RimJ/RimL family protein N-acetyltransferase
MESPVSIPEISLPVPLYTSLCIGETFDKDGEHYRIHLGLHVELAGRLKELSLDESDSELQLYTSDRKRFGEGSYEAWYAKNRTPFALVHTATEDLAGLVWFGPKPLGLRSLKHLTEEEIASEHTLNAGDWHTIVYRSYPKFRGRGLMKHFTRFTMDVYLKNMPHVKLWAGIQSNNAASAGLALHLGFEEHTEASDPDKGLLVMVKK